MSGTTSSPTLAMQRVAARRTSSAPVESSGKIAGSAFFAPTRASASSACTWRSGTPLASTSPRPSTTPGPLALSSPSTIAAAICFSMASLLRSWTILTTSLISLPFPQSARPFSPCAAHGSSVRGAETSFSRGFGLASRPWAGRVAGWSGLSGRVRRNRQVRSAASTTRRCLPRARRPSRRRAASAGGRGRATAAASAPAGRPTRTDLPHGSDKVLPPIYLAVQSTRLGSLNEDGGLDNNAWQDIGFDLDGVCTGVESCPGDDSPPSCKPTVPQISTDGHDCRDNTFGRLEYAAALIPELAKKYGLSDDAFNCALCVGDYNYLFRITELQRRGERRSGARRPLSVARPREAAALGLRGSFVEGPSVLHAGSEVPGHARLDGRRRRRAPTSATRRCSMTLRTCATATSS